MPLSRVSDGVSQLDTDKAFIRSHTKVEAVPGLDGLRLYQATQLTPLWEMTEKDLKGAQLAPPFWAFAWAGGLGLARYILEHPQAVAGKRVFDLACGSGLVAIAAMKAGAKSAMGNDIDPLCAAAVALNAALNGVEITYDGTDILAGLPKDTDIILAGDICYERAMTETLLGFLHRARNSGIEVLIGDPGRSYFPKSGLSWLAQYDITTTTETEDAATKRASVWRLE